MCFNIRPSSSSYCHEPSDFCLSFVQATVVSYLAKRGAAEGSFRKEEVVARRPWGGPLPGLRGLGRAGVTALWRPTPLKGTHYV
jgi:hypothetical protein